MRVLKRSIGGRDSSGLVAVIPEIDEDVWNLYNLIAPGDLVTAGTLRKVVRASATGASSSEKIAITLTLKVEEVSYDGDVPSVRVKGRNVSPNEHVQMGSYHTFDLMTTRKVTVEKKVWDMLDLERLDTAVNIKRTADVAALVLGSGTAQVCLMSGSITRVQAAIEQHIPKKHGGLAVLGHDKALHKFYDATIDAALRHINFARVKAVVVASPGFIREDFLEYFWEQVTKRGLSEVAAAKSKFLSIHVSASHKRALQEALVDPALVSALVDTKAVSEVAALEEFFEALHSDPDRAAYGFQFVSFAAERGAVDTLLLLDELIRSRDAVQRKRHIELVELVRAAGGRVHVFSSLHISGEQLAQLTGVAATLRFPMPHLEEMMQADRELDAVPRHAGLRVAGDSDSDTDYEDLPVAK